MAGEDKAAGKRRRRAKAGADGPPADAAGAARFRARRDGFTPERRRAFLEALARYGTVSDAARVAGISCETVRRHEKRDADFASLCRAARAKAAAPIETLAWERAVTGIEEDVIVYGKKVGTRRKRSDALFRMILMASDPEKYGHAGAVLRARIEKELRPKIEKELRPKIEAELREKLAAQGIGRMTREQRRAMRKRVSDMLSDFNRRMGGNG